MTLASCEAYPRIVTLIQYPAKTRARPGNLHLRLGTQPAPVSFEDSQPDQVKVVPGGLEITMGTRIGSRVAVSSRAGII